MANNIPIKDSTGTTQILETEETAPGSGIHAPLHIVKTLPEEPFGASSDAAITSDTTGRVIGFLRGLVKWAYERTPASLGQKTMAASLPVVLPSDQSISISAVALNAGEAHIGFAGKTYISVADTPTITAGAYTLGSNIGGVLTLASVGRVSAGTGRLKSILVFDKSKQSASFDFLFFDANPTVSTFTDTSAAIIAAGDIAKLLGSVRVKDYVTIDAQSFAQVGVDLPFKLAATSLYVAIVVRAENGLPTYASTSDLVLRFICEQD